MAINMTLRQDAENYAEGLVIGDAIIRGLGRYSWLQPNITYLNKTLSNAGVYYAPIVTGSQGAATALCADGDAGDANVEYLPIVIDKKVTGKFDGCFTVAGIADKSIEQSLNNFKLKNMQNDMQDDVLAYMVATGTESLVAKGVLPAYEYLQKLKTEYFTANEEYPTVALISIAFQDELILERIAMGDLVGDEVYVAGALGRVLGMILRPVPRLLRDAILYIPEALTIVKPANTAVIGENILGAVNSETDAFYDGLVSIQAKDALKGIVNTYVHKFYGKGIPVPDMMLVTPEIIAG